MVTPSTGGSNEFDALVFRTGLFVVLAALSACGGGGGGSGSSQQQQRRHSAASAHACLSPRSPRARRPRRRSPRSPWFRCAAMALPTPPTTPPSSPCRSSRALVTAGATLTGTTTATAVAGVATFTNLGINTAGTGYQLRFTATGRHGSASNLLHRPLADDPAATPPASQVTFAIDSTQDVRADLALHLRHERLGSGRASREPHAVALGRQSHDGLQLGDQRQQRRRGLLQPERQLPRRRHYAERRRGAGHRSRAQRRRRHARHHAD